MSNLFKEMQTKYRGLSRRAKMKYRLIGCGVIAVALITGLSAGLCCQDSIEPEPELVPTPPPNIIGWGEWSAYSSCTVSCGDGQRSRLRFCSNGEGGIDQSADGCEGDASEVILCNEGQCQSGSSLVIDISKGKVNLFVGENVQILKIASL